MPIVTQETGLFEGLVLSDLINRSQDKLKQKRGNFDRYSRQSIIDALNDGQIEATKVLRCLHGMALIVMKNGYNQYKPPSTYLLSKNAFFYQSATNYWQLKITTREWLDKFKPGWRTTSGDPLYMFPGDNYGNIRKLGFYPRPDTDGTAYESEDDDGMVVSDSAAETSGNITGQNATAHATICTDSDGREIGNLGANVGMVVVNVSTGESGQISAISGTTFTTSATDFPTGWAVGDNFNILAGEYGTIVKWDGEEQVIYNAEIGGTIDVRTIENNVYLEFIRRPLLLKYNEQYPEISPDLHQYLPDYVPFALKRNSPKGSTDAMEATIAFQAFKEGLKTHIPLDNKTSDCCTRYSL